MSLNPIYPKLLDRLRRFEIEISIPCRHGWRWAHCDRDDEGSHISEGGDGILRATDGTRVLLETDGCYCGQARRLLLPLDLLRVWDRPNRRRFLQAARAAGLTRVPRARR